VGARLQLIPSKNYSNLISFALKSAAGPVQMSTIKYQIIPSRPQASLVCLAFHHISDPSTQSVQDDDFQLTIGHNIIADIFCCIRSQSCGREAVAAATCDWQQWLACSGSDGGLLNG
jgi:hypothetical protein